MTLPAAPQPPPNRPSSPSKGWVIAGGVALFLVLGMIHNSGSNTTAPAASVPALQQSASGPTVEQQSASIPEAAPVPTGPVTSFSDGTYVVGTDVVAGTYHTTGPASDGSGLCYWEREKDTSGNPDSIIANDVGRGPTTVTISGSDVAFKTSGCNMWTKVR
jgi:hypothetical protein